MSKAQPADAERIWRALPEKVIGAIDMWPGRRDRQRRLRCVAILEDTPDVAIPI